MAEARRTTTTPAQRRRNRVAGGVLLCLVLAIFAWTLFRGADLLSHMGASP